MRHALALVLLLAACADREAGDYPRLLPIEQVLAEPALPPHAAADPDAVNRELKGAAAGLGADAAAVRAAPAVADAGGLADRAAELRARAAAMKGSAVIDPILLARMRAAAARQN